MCSLFWKVIGKVRFRQNSYTSQESLYLKAICAFTLALSNLCTTTTRNFQKLPSYTLCSSSPFFSLPLIYTLGGL